MGKNDWRYYNNGLISSLEPHETPDLSVIKDKSIWNYSGHKPAYLARWTTDFDCKQATQWWYVIKDSPFDINKISSKRRYTIRKGSKNFEVRQISDPMFYSEQLYDVQIAAFSAYPDKYRPVVDKEEFIKSIAKWKALYIVYGAFFKETGKLCGYTLLINRSKSCNLSVQKADPEYEKYSINAALIYQILQDYSSKLEDGYYICDGARNVLHETHFQDYLEKYFEFRKAYCKLHVAFHPKIRWIVKMLYPFRKMLKNLDMIGIIHKINGALVMEEYRTKEE